MDDDRSTTTAVHITSANDTAALFYRTQLAFCVAWWLLVWLSSRKPLDAATFGSCVTRPQWLPFGVLLRLQQPVVRRAIFWSVPVVLLLAAGVVVVTPVSAGLRVAIALLVSLYHLTETSITNRHGEYPLLYNIWAVCIPEPYSRAVCLGVAVHFVLCTGVAKLCVGGWSWLVNGDSMKVYLDCYRSSSTMRPLFPIWNEWMARRPWATWAISVGTIAAECVVVPSTLFLPVVWRPLGAVVMISMHVGIVCVLSARVGLAFLTTIPSYIVGFSCFACPPGGRPDETLCEWVVAVAVAFLPTVLALIVYGPMKRIPENWPLCPLSLFMWSGVQAHELIRVLMTGNTRIVLCTDSVSNSDFAAGNVQILHHGALVPREPASAGSKLPVSFAHDSVLRVVGFTMMQGGLYDFAPPAIWDSNTKTTGGTAGDGSGWDVPAFVVALQRWLRRERRLADVMSGKLLTRALYVQVEQRGGACYATRVLCDGGDGDGENLLRSR